MKVGEEIFVHVPSEGSQRVLHAGTCVGELSDGTAGVRVEMRKELRVGEGEDVFLFFEHNRTFMQQPARVLRREDGASEPSAVDGAGDAEAEPPEPEGGERSAPPGPSDSARASGPVLELGTLGDPVSAESRQSYRVSALGADIEAIFAGESRCPVLDVSATGLALYAKETVELGSRQEIVLRFEERELPGTIVIQSIRDMGNQFRYGALCVDGPLRDELGAVNLAIQRQQLRRMSGADR